MTIVSGVVEFAAIAQPHQFATVERPYYLVWFPEGEWYFAAQQPRLYDAARKLIPPQPIPPGSTVNLHLDPHDWITAVQLVAAADDCPFG
jgi:hypothetical protein